MIIDIIHSVHTIYFNIIEHRTLCFKYFSRIIDYSTKKNKICCELINLNNFIFTTMKLPQFTLDDKFEIIFNIKFVHCLTLYYTEL